MTNPKQAGLMTLEMKARFSRGWRVLCALVLAVPLAALWMVGPTPLALADAGGVPGHTFEDTFTKWVVSPGTPPVLLNMVGVVGGDVGPGSFTGEVLSNSSVGTIETLVALYHFHGSRHAFSAHVTVTQDNALNTATITGVVTDGWLEGAPVTGEYTVEPTCNGRPTPGNMFGTLCFQGTLQIQRGPDSE